MLPFKTPLTTIFKKPEALCQNRRKIVIELSQQLPHLRCHRRPRHQLQQSKHCRQSLQEKKWEQKTEQFAKENKDLKPAWDSIAQLPEVKYSDGEDPSPIGGDGFVVHMDIEPMQFLTHSAVTFWNPL